MSIILRSPDAFRVADDLVEVGTRVATRAPAVVAHEAVKYQNRVKQAASGRPGPQVLTGRYRNSIRTDGGAVYSTEPYGARLERGFTGTDKRGRNYSQPPYPHFFTHAPAAIDELAQAVADLVDGRF